MDRQERLRLRAATDDVGRWAGQAQDVYDQRASVARKAAAALEALGQAVLVIRREGVATWQVLPLHQQDGARLAGIARGHQQRPLSADDSAMLESVRSAPALAVDAQAVLGAGRFFKGRARLEAGRAAADWLSSFVQWAQAADVPERLTQLQAPPAVPDSIPSNRATEDWVGLTSWPRLEASPKVLETSTFGDLSGALRVIEGAAQKEKRAREQAVHAGHRIRSEQTRLLLSAMPVDKLQDATRERVRTGPLTDAGIRTVQQVLDHHGSLEQYPGIGAATSNRIRGAAQAIWQLTFDEMPTRIDIGNRTSETTELLSRLRAWEAVRRAVGTADDIAGARQLIPLGKAIDSRPAHLLVSANPSSAAADLQAWVTDVHASAQAIMSADSSTRLGDPWEDFLNRPADYYALLSELGFLLEDEAKAHGDLPEEIIAAVRALELDTRYLTASLRGYQSFGARFALVQRKVLIGDEMGLGKTVEALAVLAHLTAKGKRHSLVVCPAAVVTNWIREISAKSTLGGHRLHGPDREYALRSWARTGGVGVTTFETLGWLLKHTTNTPELGCVIVDEAQYIKNPDAQRSQRVSALVAPADHAVLLTGTPLENRIEEFRTLVGYLRPDLILDATEFRPRLFRKQVAPAYLRRNQEDVLVELPGLVEVDETLPMSRADTKAYAAAVAAGNFMAMRQAAMTQGPNSEKMARLIEIVEEARDNGRRVVVFSHFLEVLGQVARALPGHVVGPLTGSVPASKRQDMVDQFSNSGNGAVLVAQILAGGVGLNIQAASTVVICEPQLKPTTEWQAIARARRMGQLMTVQVHRLLSEEGVDQRLIEILARKRQLFEDFARESDTAESAPEAFDVSEAELARLVVAEERERLLNAPAAPDEPEGGEEESETA